MIYLTDTCLNYCVTTAKFPNFSYIPCTYKKKFWYRLKEQIYYSVLGVDYYFNGSRVT